MKNFGFDDMLVPRFNIVLSAVRSTPDVLNLVVFMFTMMIIFSIIGRSIFMESLENPRANFSSFSSSFTTLFQVVTGGLTLFVI